MTNLTSILLVEPDTEVRELLAKLIVSALPVHVDVASCGNEAAQLVEFGDYQLIISEYKMIKGDLYFLIESIQSNYKNKILVHTLYNKEDTLDLPWERLNSQMLYFKKESGQDEFLEIVANILGYSDNPPQEECVINDDDFKPIPQEEMASYSLKREKKEHQEEQADYSLKKEKVEMEEEMASWSLSGLKVKGENDTSYKSVSKGYALAVKQAPCDIFLKIAKMKMVKIVNAGGKIDELSIERYERKGAMGMFVEEGEYKNFSKAFSKSLFNKIDLAMKNKVATQVGQLVAYKFVQEQVRELGVSEHTIELTQKTLDSTFASFKKDEDLSAILKRIQNGKDFVSEHSLMIAYLATELCKQMDWSNQQSLQKLTMAALFHDAFLTNPHWAHFRTQAEVNQLTKDQKQNYLEHIEKSAKVVQELKDIASDVGNIIIQHHERPDGTGYPRGLNGMQIAPLSAIFILSEEITHLGSKTGFNKEKMLIHAQGMEEVFNRGNFKKPYEGLLKMFAFGSKKAA